LKLQHLNGHVEIGNHYSSNIDNTASGLNGPVPSGGIIMWNGLSTSIPDGWKLCDGTNGTPNLSGRFIVGIGSNGESSYSLGENDGEDFHQLTVSEMPSHNHGGSTSEDGQHKHEFNDKYALENNNGVSDDNCAMCGGADTDVSDGNQSRNVDTQLAGNHDHTISAQGGNQAHENRPKYYALCFIMKK
jgi:microcystin-dependent protein